MDDHIVILNWNSEGAERMLDLLYLDAKVMTIMIVTTFDSSRRKRWFSMRLKAEKKRKEMASLNIAGQASQSKASHRESARCGTAQNAKAVIIMNKEGHRDLRVIKNVLTLGQIRIRYHPPVVVEIASAQSDGLRTLAKAVEDLNEHAGLPVCFDPTIGSNPSPRRSSGERLKQLYHSLFFRLRGPSVPN
ncbi:MAG: hypothetical protein MZU97_06580 [Bacillus subtilis]|nr:hypothetical protein [Bacillus subtilis]